jgi:hypothetical protein
VELLFFREPQEEIQLYQRLKVEMQFTYGILQVELIFSLLVLVEYNNSDYSKWKSSFTDELLQVEVIFSLLLLAENNNSDYSKWKSIFTDGQLQLELLFCRLA